MAQFLRKPYLDLGHNVHVYDIMWFSNFLPEHPR